ncbi:MAG: M28 family peptidase [Candidatus Aminicenantes bacterium]|nr:M28 family peptidase [Candidatus Aminicenantes bacterium]
MRKNAWIIVLLFTLLVAGRAQMPPQQAQMKLEDVQKALSLVDKPQPVPDKYKVGFDSINAKDTMAMLTFLASDWMEGRETATKGYALAADYVVSLFKMWGIKPGGDMPQAGFGGQRGGQRGGAAATPPERSYFQNFALKSTSDVQSSMALEVNKSGALKSRMFQSGVDYQAMGRGGGEPGSLTAPVVFVGYGIQEPSIGWDELKGLNLKGKIVLLLTEAPGKDNPASPFNATKELKDKYFPAGGGQAAFAAMGPRAGGPARFNKLDAIQKLGPAAILQVQNTGKDADTYRNLSVPPVVHVNDDRPIINKPRVSLAIPGVSGGMMGGGGAAAMTITRDMANAILEATGKTIDDLKGQIETAKKPASMDVAGAKMTMTTTAKTGLVRATNVIGYIEGSDPTLKAEYFVVGAHFDHNGIWGDYIWNGADDNGSGSVGVMNIARAIALNPIKPKRTIVFGLWAGEEEGLLGSRYYTLNPTFAMDKTIGYLNYDMISRPYDATTIARTMTRYSVPGAEELVKKIRAPWFVTLSWTEGTPLADIAREMNAYVGLDLALQGNALGVGSGGSDHASFAGVKKPFVYYMAAMTTDYHQPSDSVEKVSGELIAKISQHGFLTIFAFADR